MKHMSQMLLERVTQSPNRVAFHFCGSKARDEITYGELLDRSLKVAAFLRTCAKPADRVAIGCNPGLGFIAGLFGCWLAEMVAVPVYPPKGARQKKRFSAILADCSPSVVLADNSGDHATEVTAHVVSMERALQHDAASKEGVSDYLADELALLQYTSGSTGDPKGVMLEHANLYANLESIAERFALSGADRGVIWLPPYHDMGLIGGILVPIFVGFPVMLIPPSDFARDPLIWLRGVSEFKATISGGPNFMYDYCSRRLSAGGETEFTLDSLRLCFTGAEPVQLDTLTRFVAATRDFRFGPRCLTACYGLAEATLMVASSYPGSGIRTAEQQIQTATGSKSRTYVSCGPPAPGVTIVIEDQLGNRVPPNTIGEVVVESTSVGRGYWNRPDETSRVFQVRGPGKQKCVRTGDNGFLLDGELYITGRLKDIIIIRGIKYHAEDLEHIVLGLEGGSVQAAAVIQARGAAGEETVVLIETTAEHNALERLGAAVLGRLGTEIQVTVDALVFVESRSLPRTTSGKLSKTMTRTNYQLDKLYVRHIIRPTQPTGPRLHEGGVLQALFRETGLAPPVLTKTLAMHGLDSMSAVELSTILELRYKIMIGAERLFSVTASELLEKLTGKERVPEAKTLPPTVFDDRGTALTPQQRNLWDVMTRFNSSNKSNLYRVLLVGGRLDKARFEKALLKVVRGHTALGISFQDGGSKQCFGALAEKPSIAWRTSDQDTRDVVGALYTELEAIRFNFTVGPLHHVMVTEVKGAESVIAFVTHHMVGDGLSGEIILRDLVFCYNNPTLELEEKHSYLEYAAWLASDSEILAVEKRKLLQDLVGTDLKMTLPAKRVDLQKPGFASAIWTSYIDAGTITRLMNACGRKECSDFMIILSALAVALGDWCQTSRVTLGVKTLGRTHSFKETVGFFSNTGILSVDMDLVGRDNLLSVVKTKLLTIMECQDVQIYDVNRSLPAPFSAGDYMKVLVMYHKYRGRFGELAFDGLKTEVMHRQYPDRAFVDLTVHITPVQKRLCIEFEYKSGLFEEESIVRLAESFNEALAKQLD